MAKSINPATEEVIQEYKDFSEDRVESILQQADDAYRDGVKVSADQLHKAAEHLKEKKDEFGALITSEMGKPITQSIAEVEKCAQLCEYYAKNAASFLEPRIIQTESHKSYVRYDPIGPVLAIMPWNFPFWQIFRAAVPALSAGNPVILKHASNVTGSAFAVQEVFRFIGLEREFHTVVVPGNKMERLISDPSIRGVTLTGSEAAGRSVAKLAGQNLKKCVLELGGSDPFIVLADADVQKAARTAAQARCINSGQSCIAAKRFIIESSIAESFIEAFAAALKDLKVGDPTSENTEIGPLARDDLRSDLHDQVQRSVQEGARLILGGEKKNGKGYFYETTLVSTDSAYNVALQDETFGPLAAVIQAKDPDDAVEIANNSRFGLGGSLWTSDLDRAEELCSRVETGSITVNDLLRSDVRMPFGGIKDSGFGRELGQEGILEFVNHKSVRINRS